MTPVTEHEAKSDRSHLISSSFNGVCNLWQVIYKGNTLVDCFFFNSRYGMRNYEAFAVGISRLVSN